MAGLTRKQQIDLQREAALEEQIKALEAEAEAEQAHNELSVEYEMGGEDTPPDDTVSDDEGMAPKPKRDAPAPQENTHDYEKRWKDTRSWANKEMAKRDREIKELKSKVEAMQAQPSAETIPTDPDALEQWRKDFPDSALVVDTAIEKRMEDLLAKIARLEDALESAKTESTSAKVLRKLAKSHPDWTEIRSSDEYASWVDGLSEFHRGALLNPKATAEDLVGYVDMFKAQSGWETSSKPRKTSSERPSDSRSTNSRPSDHSNSQGKKIRESEIARMTTQEYAAREAEIDEANRKGLIIMDMSGTP